MQTAGFVLVGGRSSRMGRNKARLPVDSRMLVELVAATVATAAGSVTLVGNPAEFSDLALECIADLRGCCGPMAGLEAALASGRGELNLVVGCDMPDIRASDLSNLLAICYDTPALCAVAKDASGRKHPLCAVYRSAALAQVRASLDSSRWRLHDLVEELKAVEVAIDSTLNNVNTPADWAGWQKARAV